MPTWLHPCPTREPPIFPEEGVDFAVKVILWMDQNIERVKWTDRQIERMFARRSAESVIIDRNTCYMNPCIDLTLATGSIAQRNGIPHTLVIEEHGKTKEFPFNRIHFVLELQEPGQDYFINYKTGNRVIIGEGKYMGRPDLPQVKMMRVDWTQLNYALPLHRSLGSNTMYGALKKNFPHCEFTKQINKLKRDNTEENYADYQRVCGKKFTMEVIKEQ